MPKIFHELKPYILSKQNTPTPALQKILECCGISSTLPLPALVEHTQEVWLRPAGTERWHLPELQPQTKAHLLKIFRAVGMVDAIMPPQKKFDYMLYMGGDLPGMRERLAFMLELWKQGITVKKIVFLTAQRKLDAEHESLAKINDLTAAQYAINNNWKPITVAPETECELLKVLYAQADVPQTLQDTPTEFVNTPNQMRNGKECRATTPDALNEWYASQPKPGSCLVISSQPLVGYQDAVTHTLLPNEFIIESVGCHAAPDVTSGEYFDTLARWLYQENIRAEHNNL